MCWAVMIAPSSINRARRAARICPAREGAIGLSEMFLLPGIVFSYKAVQDWEATLTPALAEDLRRRRRGRVGRSWYVDETYLKVQGRWVYLYRAIDRSGALVNVMLSETRDMTAAKAFFRSAKMVTG